MRKKIVFFPPKKEKGIVSVGKVVAIFLICDTYKIAKGKFKNLWIRNDWFLIRNLENYLVKDERYIWFEEKSEYEKYLE